MYYNEPPAACLSHESSPDLTPYLVTGGCLQFTDDVYHAYVTSQSTANTAIQQIVALQYFPSDDTVTYSISQHTDFLTVDATTGDVLLTNEVPRHKLAGKLFQHCLNVAKPSENSRLVSGEMLPDPLPQGAHGINSRNICTSHPSG